MRGGGGGAACKVAAAVGGAAAAAAMAGMAAAATTGTAAAATTGTAAATMDTVAITAVVWSRLGYLRRWPGVLGLGMAVWVWLWVWIRGFLPVYSTSYPVYSGADTGATGSFISAPDPRAIRPTTGITARPRGYYPYVQNCSRGWMQVVPQNVPNSPAPQ
jgi:hypothetical protein